MSILDKEFLTFVQKLNEHRVEYLLIGGHAVNFYGYSRPTADLDLWVNPTVDNGNRLMKALEQLSYKTAKLLERDFTKPLAFNLGEPPFQIDVLNRISGLEFSGAYSRRDVTMIEGIAVNIIHLHDLRTNKLASGRHRDLDDLENLATP